MTTRVGERRRSREYAVQLLYQLDLSPQDPDDVLEGFWEGKNAQEPVRRFAEQIVRGTMACRDGIDEVLASCALHWRVGRMAVVDRNILRMAIYEFLFQPLTPGVVVIDEAIEIAKKFGNDESGPFINGILDAIRIRLESGELAIPEALQASRESSTA